MKLKSLIAIASLVLCAQGAMAQPKSRIQAQKDAEKKAETSLSERAKAQYTAQLPAPTDVVWKRDIYRTLDLTKEKNAALYYPVEPLGDRVNLFTLIIRLIASGKVPAYEYRSDGNELFTPSNKYKVYDMLDKFYIYYETKDSINFTINNADIPAGEVLSYFIKESSFYDQRTATYTTRVTAICPVLHRSGDFGNDVTKYPMFWLNYDDVSPYFGMTPLMTSSYNNVSNMSIDDYFVRNLYEGDIYKTANLQNKLLAQYCTNDTTMKAEQQRIEKELVTFENTLWGIEEPDTTTVLPAQKSEKKPIVRATVRPSAQSSVRTQKPEPTKQETKTEKKSSDNKSNTSVRTTRQRSNSTTAKSSGNSGQTLSVRRERR